MLFYQKLHWNLQVSTLTISTLTMPRRLPPTFGNPDESPGWVLVMAANAWQRRLRSALDELGLTPVQSSLLAAVVWLNRDDTPVTQTRLARHARTDPMMASQVLRALETKKLIRRLPHPSDTRARTLRPTARGRKLAREAAYAADRVDREFFEAVGDPSRLRGQLSELL